MRAVFVVERRSVSWKKDLISMEEYYEIRDMFVFFGLSITETFSTPDELMDILMNNEQNIDFSEENQREDRRAYFYIKA